MINLRKSFPPAIKCLITGFELSLILNSCMSAEVNKTVAKKYSCYVIYLSEIGVAVILTI